MADNATVVALDYDWAEIPGVAGKNFQFMNKSVAAIQIASSTTKPAADYSYGVLVPAQQWCPQPMTFAVGEKAWFRCTSLSAGYVHPMEVA
jgi:hypothetical protein